MIQLKLTNLANGLPEYITLGAIATVGMTRVVEDTETLKEGEEPRESTNARVSLSGSHDIDVEESLEDVLKLMGLAVQENARSTNANQLVAIDTSWFLKPPTPKTVLC